MQTLDALKPAANAVLIFNNDNNGVGGYDRPGGVISVPLTVVMKTSSMAAALDSAPITHNARMTSSFSK